MRLLRPRPLPSCSSCRCSPPARRPARAGAGRGHLPLSGTQGMGGIDEYHGVEVAAELVNADGGIGGRPVVLDQVDVPEADAAPGAIEGPGRPGCRPRSSAATAAPSRARRPPPRPAAARCSGRPGRSASWPARVRATWCSGRPTGGLLGRGAIRFVADQLAPSSGGRRPRCASPSPPWTTSTATRWPTGPGPSCATAGWRSPTWPTTRAATTRPRWSRGRAAPARRAVRGRLPGGRGRPPARAGPPAPAPAGQHRHLLQLLHAGVRGAAGTGRRRPVRLRQARHPRDQPSGLAPDARALLDRADAAYQRPTATR